MKRRSFFQMLFGGLLASRLPKEDSPWDAAPKIAKFKAPDDPPRYRFGFTGFKPAEAFQYHPIAGGRYKPGAPITMAGGPMAVPIKYEPRDVAVPDEYWLPEK